MTSADDKPRYDAFVLRRLNGSSRLLSITAFLDEHSPGQYEMHPLSPGFLELKLREEGHQELR